MSDDYRSLKCPYCNRDAELVTGAVIYPHRPDLAHKKIFRCEPCDARVGCHAKSGEPLGRLANAELRKAKMETHEVFDKLWKKEHWGIHCRSLTRGEAYRWLRLELNMTRDECHIGMFSVEKCQAAQEAVARINEHMENSLGPPCPNCKSIEHCGVYDCHKCGKTQCEDCSCNNMHFACEAVHTHTKERN